MTQCWKCREPLGDGQTVTCSLECEQARQTARIRDAFFDRGHGLGVRLARNTKGYLVADHLLTPETTPPAT